MFATYHLKFEFVHEKKLIFFFVFIGNIRVCNYCYKIVKAYVEDDIDKSLEALKEDMSKCSDDLSASEPFGQVSSSLTASRNSLSSYDPGVRGVGSTNSLPGIIERDLRSQQSVPHYPFDAFGVTPKEAKDIKQVRQLLHEISFSFKEGGCYHFFPQKICQLS